MDEQDPAIADLFAELDTIMADAEARVNAPGISIEEREPLHVVTAASTPGAWRLNNEVVADLVGKHFAVIAEMLTSSAHAEDELVGNPYEHTAVDDPDNMLAASRWDLETRPQIADATSSSMTCFVRLLKGDELDTDDTRAAASGASAVKRLLHSRLGEAAFDPDTHVGMLCVLADAVQLSVVSSCFD